MYLARRVPSDRLSAEGLDASCLDEVERPAFEGGNSD